MHPYNFRTNVIGRTQTALKDATLAQIHEQIVRAQRVLHNPNAYALTASLYDVPVALHTNDDHLRFFWSLNWPTSLKEPLINIYAVVGIAGLEPQAWYNSETKTIVLINTNYYGQSKSWALGAVADLLEERGVLCVHASCLCDENLNALLIVAPTGTGKSVHLFGLHKRFEELSLVCDDWGFISFEERCMVSGAEKWFYMRADLVASFPHAQEIFDQMPAENVLPTLEGGRDYVFTPNARVMVDPSMIGKRVQAAFPKVVVLLRRDSTSPVEQELSSVEALSILERGEYQMLPGSGPAQEWGKIVMEPWYNPYLLVRRLALQRQLFKKLLDQTKIVCLNTAKESVENTSNRIVSLLLRF